MTERGKIVSRQNERIREAKKLGQRKYREQRGLFLVEGVRLVEEALAAGAVEQLFFHRAPLGFTPGAGPG